MIKSITFGKNLLYQTAPKTAIQLPSGDRNYTLFDYKKVDSYVNQGEKALLELKDTLEKSNDERQIVETLYILDRMLDKGVNGIGKLYPQLSRFNESDSANIQTFLAGIYRKTQVPDAFGPLVKMLIKDSMQNPNKSGIKTFDPTEEIGGAILEYIRNYSNKTKTLDYKA